MSVIPGEVLPSTNPEGWASADDIRAATDQLDQVHVAALMHQQICGFEVESVAADRLELAQHSQGLRLRFEQDEVSNTWTITRRSQEVDGRGIVMVAQTQRRLVAGESGTVSREFYDRFNTSLRPLTYLNEAPTSIPPLTARGAARMTSELASLIRPPQRERSGVLARLGRLAWWRNS